MGGNYYGNFNDGYSGMDVPYVGAPRGGRATGDAGQAFYGQFNNPRRIPYLGAERKALGGAVKAGQPYVVGDSPDGMPTGNEELFVPEQDGTIVPSQNTRGRLGGADYLKAIKEEMDVIRLSDEDLAYKLLAGTGLESVLGRRNRSKSLQMS